jgi:hypothetical protein
MKFAHLAAALGTGLALSGPCLADDLVAGELFTGTQVGFELKGTFRHVTLSISGPNAFHVSAEARRRAPTIDLARAGPVEDGLYTYQLHAASDDRVKLRTTLDNGRDGKEPDEISRGIASSGVFRVRNGAIVPIDRNAREERQPAR